MEMITGLLRCILDAVANPQPVSPWLTVTRADRYVHQSNGTVSRLCKAGIIESRKIGNTRFVHTDWLDAWMESNPSGVEAQFSAIRQSGRL